MAKNIKYLLKKQKLTGIEAGRLIIADGEKSPAGRLCPTGHTRLRSLLVEAIWVWKGRDNRVQAYYARILCNIDLTQKAITAVAQKLAIILWRLAYKVRAYRPA